MPITLLIKWNTIQDWTMLEMNGSLSIHSDGSATGVVFTLELPFQTQETVE